MALDGLIGRYRHRPPSARTRIPRHPPLPRAVDRHRPHVARQTGRRHLLRHGAPRQDATRRIRVQRAGSCGHPGDHYTVTAATPANARRARSVTGWRCIGSMRSAWQIKVHMRDPRLSSTAPAETRPHRWAATTTIRRKRRRAAAACNRWADRGCRRVRIRQSW